MRVARTIIVTLVALGCPRLGSAQLPLPKLDSEGPKIRLANADGLIDEVQVFLDRLTRRRDQRRTAFSDARLIAQSEIERLKQSGGDLVEIASAEKLLASYSREQALLDESVRLLESLVQGAGRGEATRRPPSLDAEIERVLEVRRAAREFAQRERAADRLAAISAVEPAKVATSVEDRLAQQDWRVQAALAMRASARLLESKLRLRRARAPKPASVSLSDSDVTAAAREEAEALAAAKRTATTLEREREEIVGSMARGQRARNTRLREALRAGSLAQLDLLERRRDLEAARVARARARHVAARGYREPNDHVRMPDDLSGARVDAQLARVAQLELTVSSEIQRLRSLLGSTDQLVAAHEAHIATVEQSKASLRKTTEAYEVVAAISVLAESGWSSAPGQGPASTQGILLSILVVLIAVLLLRSLRHLHRITEVNGPLQRWLRLKAGTATQIDAALSLSWPVVVIVGAGAVLVWGVWGLDITYTEFLQIFERPLFYVGEKPVSLFSILQLLFAIWAAAVLSRILRDFLSTRVYPRTGWDIGLTNALNTLVKYVSLAVGGLLGLRFVGIGLDSLAIFAGVLGIGIGFGLRNIAENFISGLIILAERPIKIGDFVQVGEHTEGQIREINARSTTLITRDNISLIIPNSEFVGARVINWSHGDPKVRITVSVGVAYGSNTELVRRLLLEAARNHGQILKKPKPEVQFSAFADSCLQMTLLVWIDEQQHRFRIASDLHFAVDKAFRKHRVEISFPQLDVHLRSVDEEAGRNLAALPTPEVDETTRPSVPVKERPTGSVLSNLPG